MDSEIQKTLQSLVHAVDSRDNHQQIQTPESLRLDDLCMGTATVIEEAFLFSSSSWSAPCNTRNRILP